MSEIFKLHRTLQAMSPSLQNEKVLKLASLHAKMVPKLLSIFCRRVPSVMTWEHKLFSKRGQLKRSYGEPWWPPAALFGFMEVTDLYIYMPDHSKLKEKNLILLPVVRRPHHHKYLSWLGVGGGGPENLGELQKCCNKPLKGKDQMRCCYINEDKWMC